MDTGTSDNICRLRHLFIPGSLRTVSGVSINGVGGTIPVIGIGSIKLAIKDDDDKVHQLIIHNVLLAPEAPINLLSPQKIAQQHSKDSNKKGTFLLTFGYESIFIWGDRKYRKTVVHPPHLNIPLLAVNNEKESFI